MQSIGPVLLRDIDEAQEAVVRGANALAARGEISIAKRQPGAATDISNEDRR
jgi:flagellar motor switch protein FliG